MSHCPKCDSEVNEEMAFCPKCGAPLRTERPEDWREELRSKRREWREHRREWRRQGREAEKNQEEEKWEKTEKHEYIFAGPLIGGLVLIILGVLLYFFITNGFSVEILAALFFVLVGAIIIAATVYGAVVAGRRHPKP
jgi:uncharacterized membrane protein YvbJ